jgi:hypothetical protein
VKREEKAENMCKKQGEKDEKGKSKKRAQK